MPEPSANLVARLVDRCDRHPDRLALVGPDGRGWTFAALRDQVYAWMHRLRADGVGEGDPVLLFVPMSPALYAVLLAVIGVGGTALFVDAWADRRRLAAAVRTCRPKLFVGSLQAQLLRWLVPEVGRLPAHRVAWAGRRLSPPVEAPPLAVVGPDHPALITFTTGSTGRPKATRRTHGLLWAQHESLARHLALRDDDVDSPSLPIFVLNNLALGLPSVLPDADPRRPAEVDPARVLRQWERHGVTTAVASPSFFVALARWAAARGRTLPLRALFTGGAPITLAQARQLLAATDGEVHFVYGSSEAEPIAGLTAAAFVERIEGGAPGVPLGRPVPEVEVRLIRPVDAPVVLGAEGWAPWLAAEGEVGEVVVTGPHVLPSYFLQPDEDARHKIRDGGRVWHRTGDAACLRGGELYLFGRVADRIARGGRTLWSLPVETAALRDPAVTYAAYRAVDDGTGTPLCVLCLEVDRAARQADWSTRMPALLPDVPVDQIVVMDHIPRDRRHASKTDTGALLVLLRQILERPSR